MLLGVAQGDFAIPRELCRKRLRCRNDILIVSSQGSPSDRGYTEQHQTVAYRSMAFELQSKQLGARQWFSVIPNLVADTR